MKVTLKLFYKYVIPSIENAVTVCQLSQRKKNRCGSPSRGYVRAAKRRNRKSERR